MKGCCRSNRPHRLQCKVIASRYACVVELTLELTDHPIDMRHFIYPDKVSIGMTAAGRKQLKMSCAQVRSQRPTCQKDGTFSVFWGSSFVVLVKTPNGPQIRNNSELNN